MCSKAGKEDWVNLWWDLNVRIKSLIDFRRFRTMMMSKECALGTLFWCWCTECQKILEVGELSAGFCKVLAYSKEAGVTLLSMEEERRNIP